MKKLRNLMIITIILVGSFILAFGITFRYYSAPKSDSKEMKEVTIPDGTSGAEVGQILYDNGLIKSSKFFKIYLRLFKIDGLKSGKYELSESMNIDEIIEVLQKGNNYNANEISITFPEGINMRQIAKIIEKETNNSADDVLKLVADEEYLKSLINEYWFITDDILDKNIYYPLEGYLFPDSYRFNNKDVSIKDIFAKLLDEMDKKLLVYKEDIDGGEYSVHELLTIASLAEKEVSASHKEDRKNVASVFYNRLAKGMSLGSDVTTRYSLKLDETRPLTAKEYDSVNAYNTRSSALAGKLPAGPISTVSVSSIEAAIKPASAKYLYFISNIKTGETFFYENYNDFVNKKNALSSVNGGY